MDAAIRLEDIVRELNLKVHCGQELLKRQASGGYVGDLMSDVLAHARPGNVWVTMQVHENTVAVAVRNELAAIIISQGREPSKEALQKAASHEIVLLTSNKSSFETVAALERLGLDARN
ncbi:MAG TPA: DRTGG domain-containing protein [Bacteroidota bacterium]|nr:DRTGG domain-containing protein [Bacteroidota bacterium]